DGADALFARAVLDLGAPLEAIVPAERYRAGLPADHHPVYDALLAHARLVHRLPHVDSTARAHLEAGHYMVDHCDELIAVWDGRPARGPGGTADIVDYARAADRATTVVWPEGARRRPLGTPDGEGGPGQIPAKASATSPVRSTPKTPPSAPTTRDSAAGWARIAASSRSPSRSAPMTAPPVTARETWSTEIHGRRSSGTAPAASCETIETGAPEESVTRTAPASASAIRRSASASGVPEGTATARRASSRTRSRGMRSRNRAPRSADPAPIHMKPPSSTPSSTMKTLGIRPEGRYSRNGRPTTNTASTRPPQAATTVPAVGLRVSAHT